MNAQQIKRAIDTEFPGAEPSDRVWQQILSQLPRRRSLRLRLASGFAALLIVSMAGVGFANTKSGQELLDWVFERFGIHLVDGDTLDLPPLAPEDRAKPANLEEVQAQIPAGMKLPTYLPESMTQIRLQLRDRGAGVNWSGGGRRAMSVWYHDFVFGEGSKTGTLGEARDIQEVDIGGKPGLAFRDDAGWRLDWALDGHQYTVLTNISLEEAIRVAESIQ